MKTITMKFLTSPRSCYRIFIGVRLLLLELQLLLMPPKPLTLLFVIIVVVVAATVTATVVVDAVVVDAVVDTAYVTVFSGAISTMVAAANYDNDDDHNDVKQNNADAISQICQIPDLIKEFSHLCICGYAIMLLINTRITCSVWNRLMRANAFS